MAFFVSIKDIKDDWYCGIQLLVNPRSFLKVLLSMYHLIGILAMNFMDLVTIM
jgi:hypothetical protein